MRRDVNRHEQAARFLLGKLEEARRSEFEEAYFVDDRLFEQLLATEDDLIDAYVRGALAPADRKRFEERFMLSAGQRERVKFAELLRKQLVQAPGFSTLTSRSYSKATRFKSLLERAAAVLSPGRLSLATAMLLLAALGAWWFVYKEFGQAPPSGPLVAINSQPMKTVDESGSQSENGDSPGGGLGHTDAPNVVNGGGKVKAQPPPRHARTEPVIASLVLSQGLTRDAEGMQQVLVLPTQLGVVRLQVNFEPGAYSDFQARLETVEGKEVWNQKRLKSRPAAGGKAVVMSIRSEKLSEGDYILTLSGRSGNGPIEKVNEYSFRVVKEQHPHN